jgi:N-sulfoglucosamine sulfohydrolase
VDFLKEWNMTNAYTRRDFLAGLGASAATFALTHRLWAADSARPNILLITADDMDYHSLGVTGCKVPDITPNIDALAKQGMLFTQAHVTAAVCQPSRSALMTGRFPHRNGAMGFEPIDPKTPTLEQSLNKAGYLNGIMAKVGHLAPRECFMWDLVVDALELGEGRDAGLYYKLCTEYFNRARTEGKPFFLMANSQDPHRPFAGSGGEKATAEKRKVAFPGATRTYRPEEVTVPDFLPDLPDVRKEIAQYFTSVHRCDETVGQILRALKESGMEENTVVFFMSDNGISQPFAKTNCYKVSTQTPLIVRWPGKIKPGARNTDDLVSGIDFMPTALDVAGIKQIEGMDGRSYLPLLEGRKDAGHDKVFTFLFETSAKKEFPIRCVRTKRYSYIYNAWSDGETTFQNEPMGGLAWKAMVAAAPNNKQVAERVDFYLHRVPEEFYDLEADPGERKNLITDPKYKDQVAKMRAEMLRMMESTKDPILDKFRKQIGG